MKLLSELITKYPASPYAAAAANRVTTIAAKYQANATLAGWNDAKAARAKMMLTNLFGDDDLSQLAALRA